MSTKKEETKEIASDKVAEEVKEITQEELKDEVSDKVAEAPVLKAATPALPNNMIHKHLDNFLAKIAGETPIDENVRDSTEYWLNRINDVVMRKTIKLWENEDSTVPFPAQDIEIDLSMYRFVIVAFRASVSSINYCYAIGGVGNGGQVFYATTARFGHHAFNVGIDKVSFTGAKSVEWANISGGLASTSSYGIPIAIYGIE